MTGGGPATGFDSITGDWMSGAATGGGTVAAACLVFGSAGATGGMATSGNVGGRWISGPRSAGGTTMSGIAPPAAGRTGMAGPLTGALTPPAGAGWAAVWASVTPRTPTSPRASMAMWMRRTGHPLPEVRDRDQRSATTPDPPIH